MEVTEEYVEKMKKKDHTVLAIIFLSMFVVLFVIVIVMSIAGGAEAEVRFKIEDYDGISSDALELIYEDSEYSYYLSSIRSEKIMITFEDGRKMNLRDAISLEILTIERLIENGLETIKEKR